MKPSDHLRTFRDRVRPHELLAFLSAAWPLFQIGDAGLPYVEGVSLTDAPEQPGHTLVKVTVKVQEAPFYAVSRHTSNDAWATLVDALVEKLKAGEAPRIGYAGTWGRVAEDLKVLGYVIEGVDDKPVPGIEPFDVLTARVAALFPLLDHGGQFVGLQCSPSTNANKWIVAILVRFNQNEGAKVMHPGTGATYQEAVLTMLTSLQETLIRRLSYTKTKLEQDMRQVNATVESVAALDRTLTEISAFLPAKPAAR